MAWVYLDDHFPDHPKIVLAGGDAGWLWACGLAYVRRYATEGRIPKGQVPKLSDRKNPARLAQRLVDVGLWLDEGEHYRYHDYGDWNKPQASRSEAGRKAAQARWAKEANRNANASADASETQSEPPYEDDADPDASECPPPQPPPSPDLHPPPNSREYATEPVGEDSVIDRALQLAADRYVQHEQSQGHKVDSPSGLRKWWLQENAEGARVRAANLLEDHDLAATQLADALASVVDPPWLASYRRRKPAEDVERPELATVRDIAERTRRHALRPYRTEDTAS